MSTSPASQQTRVWQRTLEGIALVLCLAGLVIMAGWLVQWPVLVRLDPGRQVVHFNTALSFALLGIALWLQLRGGSTAQRTSIALAAGVFTLHAVIQGQTAWGAALGVDLPGLHAWLALDQVHPGRVNAFASVAFCLAAAHLLTWNTAVRAASWSAIGVTLLGTMEVVGNLLSVDRLFEDYPVWGMSLGTATLMLALGVAEMARAWRSAASAELRPDRRIMLVATSSLAVILLIAGVCAFALIKSELDKAFSNERFSAVKARAQLYDFMISQGLADARSLADQTSLHRHLREANAGRDRALHMEHLRAELSDSQKLGHRAIVILDARRNVIAQAGELELEPALSVPLQSADAARLLWHGGAILETEMPIADARGVLGFVLTQRNLAALSGLSLDETGLGKSGTYIMCGRANRLLHCLPNRSDAQVSVMPADTAENRSPAFLAMAGEAGVSLRPDVRGVNIMAAYTQVGEHGLSLVFRMDTAEVYAPLARFILTAGPLFLLLLFVGTAIIRLQIAPLATRLYRSERLATSTNAALVSLSEKLQHSEDRLRKITDNIPALISYIDRDGRYRFVSEYYRDVFGIEPETLLGTQVAELAGPDMYRELAPWMGQALAGMPVRFQIGRVAGGVERHYQLCYLPDYGADGVVQGFYSLTHDISEQKAMANALAHSEQRMRSITDNIPALISHVNAAERYEFVNEHYLKFCDQQAGAVLGKTVREILGDETYFSIKEHIDAALAGLPASFERYAMVRGEQRFTLTSLVPEIDACGKVTGFLGMTQDLTARKAIEKARRSSDERLRTITDNLPALIAYIDQDRRFQFANSTWEDWLGLPRSEIVGYKVTTVLDAASSAQLLPHIDKALKGEHADFEAALTLNGELQHVRGNFQPHYDESLEVQGVYGMISDVTELKLVELQLSKLARFDSLTGLPNRSLLHDRLETAIQRSRRENELLAVMFLDLDRFKSVNDRHGHAAGDAVLKEFAARLTSVVRQTDTVARLAGDEFVILLEGLHNEDEVQFVARKLLIATERDFVIDGKVLQHTTSIGVTLYRGEDISADTLLARADVALYEAKRLGRNRFRMAS